jgi:hypothetical protein
MCDGFLSPAADSFASLALLSFLVAFIDSLCRSQFFSTELCNALLNPGIHSPLGFQANAITRYSSKWANPPKSATLRIRMRPACPECRPRPIVGLVKTWRSRGLQQRQDLAFSLYPDGLVFSRETLFFEPRNDLLMNGMEEMSIAYWQETLEHHPYRF